MKNNKEKYILDFDYFQVEIYNLLLFDRMSFEIQKRNGMLKDYRELGYLLHDSIEKEGLKGNSSDYYKVVWVSKND